MWSDGKERKERKGRLDIRPETGRMSKLVVAK